MIGLIGAIFLASFFNVMLLGLQSQIVRDQRMAAAFSISWGISVSQYVYTYTVARADGIDAIMTFLSAATGGSLGIVTSILLYRYMLARKSK